MFVDSTALLCESSTCAWASTTELRAFPGPGATLGMAQGSPDVVSTSCTEGSSLQLLPQVVMSVDAAAALAAAVAAEDVSAAEASAKKECRDKLDGP